MRTVSNDDPKEADPLHGLVPRNRTVLRRLALPLLPAAALVLEPELLLLDEPVTGLDPIATGEMYNLIKLVNLCDNITVVMVSHDIHAAARYATHILHMGREYFFGTAEEYRKSEYGRLFLT